MVVKKRLMFFFHFAIVGFRFLSKFREPLDDFSFYVIFYKVNISE
jgi:hypothetical protein